MGSTTRRHRRRVTGQDSALVARLRAGDADAFDELYRRHLPALTRYVAARLRARDRDSVDDCVHDAFCDALADPSLAARAVTRHDWSRRRYVRAAYTVYEDTTPTGQPATAAQAVEPVRISHALARLSDDQRRAVQLRYLDGHPLVVVAVLMGRTVDAVATLQRQALRHLRSDLTIHQPRAEFDEAIPAAAARCPA
jgi:RNA polymerase sigma-70 factor (ECF subfamily)